ncbi:MAG TPA: FAD-dependent monooxygenase [Gaiellaceae bacterium]|nr:FAD-dependent monooxygenase [Gaiellaceae bacterium]
MTDAAVIVVGGGPAGAATAAALSADGIDVLVLDRARFPRDKACAEFLSPGAVAALARLGLADAAGARGSWQEGMRIVSGGAAVTLRYEAPRRGLGIPRRELDALLLAAARAAGAEVREGVSVAAAVVEAGRVRGVRLRDGRVLRADLVVGADGLRSPVARSLGLERPARWPRRLGLVARVRGIPPRPLGLMAVGRLGYCGVASVGAETSVGMAVSPRARRPGESASALFERVLASLPEAARAVEGATDAGPLRGVAPLARRVSRVAGTGFLLVGDAAGFVDPFTGEGVHRALRGAELAAAAAARALARRDREPVGYAEERRSAFAAKERAVLLLQAALAAPPVFDHCLRRAGSSARVARTLAGVFGDYVPANAALRPSLVAALLRP